MLRKMLLLLALPLLGLAATAWGEPRQPVLVQALVGAGDYDRESLTFVSRTSSGEAVEDLSSQPVFGVVGQFPLAAGRGEFGIETSALYSWRARNTTIVSDLNQTVIHIDTSFWLLDLAIGLYAATAPDARWRFYAGGGPALLFADYREDRSAVPTPLIAADEVDQSHSEFGVGGYLRAGLEYQLTPGGYVGLCVRGMTSSLAFAPPTGSGSEVAGVQGFVTFSRWF